MATLADLQALQQRQQLAQIMAMQRPMGNNQGARAAAGIGALVNALAAKNLGGKAQAMQNEIQQGDQATLAGLLSTGVNKPGTNLAEIAQIQDPQMRELALSLAGKGPDSRKTATDALGRRRYLDTGELVFKDAVPDDMLVSPREKYEQGQDELKFEREKEERLSTKLSATSEKALDQAQTAAIEAGRQRFEMESLANDYEALAPEMMSGTAGNWRETFKQVAGAEDAVTVLRTRYSALRNSAAISNLPPGVASDRDIALALEGFLPPGADPETVASFLRGMSKMSEFDQVFNEFKANYINENNSIRGLLKDWKGSEELASLQSGLTSAEKAEPVDDEVPEGTIIQNTAGEMLILQNGEWVPHNG